MLHTDVTRPDEWGKTALDLARSQLAEGNAKLFTFLSKVVVAGPAQICR